MHCIDVDLELTLGSTIPDSSCMRQPNWGDGISVYCTVAIDDVLSTLSCADVGASRLIADGKIKLKNDSQIKELTEIGILFENGSEVPADVVICATG